MKSRINYIIHREGIRRGVCVYTWVMTASPLCPMHNMYINTMHELTFIEKCSQ